MRIPWYGLPIVAHAPAHSAAKAKRVPSGDQLAPPISVQEPPHLTLDPLNEVVPRNDRERSLDRKRWAAVPLAEHVHRGSEEIRRRVVDPANPVPSLEDPNERLLSDLLSLVPVLRQETERPVEALVVALDEALEALDLRDEWLVVSLHESERLFHGAWTLEEGILLQATSRFSSIRTRERANPLTPTPKSPTTEPVPRHG
jgi:hypothetical protein